MMTIEDQRQTHGRYRIRGGTYAGASAGYNNNDDDDDDNQILFTVFMFGEFILTDGWT